MKTYKTIDQLNATAWHRLLKVLFVIFVAAIALAVGLIGGALYNSTNVEYISPQRAVISNDEQGLSLIGDQIKREYPGSYTGYISSDIAQRLMERDPEEFAHMKLKAEVSPLLEGRGTYIYPPYGQVVGVGILVGLLTGIMVYFILSRIFYYVVLGIPHAGKSDGKA